MKRLENGPKFHAGDAVKLPHGGYGRVVYMSEGTSGRHYRIVTELTFKGYWNWYPEADLEAWPAG